jgi:hypothetical protein
MHTARRDGGAPVLFCDGTTLGRRCDWEELSKMVSSRSFGVQIKPIRPEPHPTSRFAARREAFLAELFEEWNGHLDEISSLQSNGRAIGFGRRLPHTQNDVCIPRKLSKAFARLLALTFPDTSLFIKVVRSLERKIDERLPLRRVA